MIQLKKDRIIQLANETAKECGFEIYDIVVQFQKNRFTIDVRIDNRAVVSHNDCALFSRSFSLVLDQEEFADTYYLEVSSPGLKRKLRTAEEMARFVKAPVKVVFTSENRVISEKGELISVNDQQITISTHDKKKTVTIAIDTIKSANLDY